MIPVSQRWRDTVGHPTRWTVRVTWTADGTTWHDVVPLDCTVTEDATQQVRWKCTCTLHERDAVGLSVFGTRLRVFAALIYPNGDREEIQLGDYRVDTIDHGWFYQRTAQIPAASIECVSWEQQLVDAQLTVPRQVEGPAFQVIDMLVQSVLPGVPVSWDANDIYTRWVPSTVIEKDLWGWIGGRSGSESSFAKSFGVAVFTDHKGVFRVAKPSSLTDSPTLWELTAGQGGVQLSASHKVTRTGAFNAVVVKGSSSTDAASFGPIVVRDLSTSSRTSSTRPAWSQGGFGLIPTFYESNLITDAGQAFDAGRAMLEPVLGARRTVEMGTHFDPAIRADDVGIVQTASGPTRVVLDQVDCDLVAGTMSCKARTMTGDPRLLSVATDETAGGSGGGGETSGSTTYETVKDHGTYSLLVAMTYSALTRLGDMPAEKPEAGGSA